MRVTVKVSIWEPLLPSVIVDIADRRRSRQPGRATSSLTMVPMPWAFAIVAPLVAPERLTLKLSLASTLVSPLTTIETSVGVPGVEMQRPCLL